MTVRIPSFLSATKYIKKRWEGNRSKEYKLETMLWSHDSSSKNPGTQVWNKMPRQAWRMWSTSRLRMSPLPRVTAGSDANAPSRFLINSPLKAAPSADRYVKGEEVTGPLCSLGGAVASSYCSKRAEMINGWMWTFHCTPASVGNGPLFDNRVAKFKMMLKKKENYKKMWLLWFQASQVLLTVFFYDSL